MKKIFYALLLPLFPIVVLLDRFLIAPQMMVNPSFRDSCDVVFRAWKQLYRGDK